MKDLGINPGERVKNVHLTKERSLDRGYAVVRPDRRAYDHCALGLVSQTSRSNS